MLQLGTVQGQASGAGARARGLGVIMVLRQHHDHILLAVLVCWIINPSWQLSRGPLEEEHLAGYTNHLWKTTNTCGFKDKRCKAMMCDECMHMVIVLAFSGKRSFTKFLPFLFIAQK